MTTEQSQPGQNKAHLEVEATDLPGQFTGESRRRFTKAGLAASGVMVTLASRPVLGCTTTDAPSGFVSGDVSHRGQTQGSCGVSPGYWKNHTDWPPPMKPDAGNGKPSQNKHGLTGDNNDGTLFSSVFDCTKSRSAPYAAIAMSDLLDHQAFDVSNLGMHCVAAYLNALAGMTPFLPANEIVKMFNQWAATGYFYPLYPATSVKWDAAQIVDYLTKTQD